MTVKEYKKRYQQSEKGKASQKRAQIKYSKSEKGKAAIQRYLQSDKSKERVKKYFRSEGFKQRRRDHPDIYKEPFLTRSVGRLLEFQEQRIKKDPESLTPDFISKIMRIKRE